MSHNTNKHLKVNYSSGFENKKIYVKLTNDILETLISNCPYNICDNNVTFKFNNIILNKEKLGSVIQQFGNCINFRLDVSIAPSVQHNSSDFEYFPELVTPDELETFLQSDIDGINILKEYEEKNKLIKTSRKRLVKFMVNYLLTNFGDDPGNDEKIAIAKATCALFPTFKVPNSQFDGIDLFYDPEKNTGFLASKLKRIKIKRQKKELKKEQKREQKKSEHNRKKPKLENVEEINFELKLKIEDREFFKTCEVETQTYLIKLKLRETLIERIEFINAMGDIKKHFPFYFQKPELILYDFKIRHPIVSDNLLTGWEGYSSKIESVLKAATGKTFESLGSWNYTIKTFLGLLKLLPAIYIGTHLKYTERLNFQDTCNLLVQFENINTPPSQFDKSIKKPHIIAVGPNRISLSQFYIQIDVDIIPLPLHYNFIQAFDVLFKIYYIFHININPNLIDFYNFFALYVYKISRSKPSDNLVQIFSQFK